MGAEPPNESIVSTLEWIVAPSCRVSITDMWVVDLTIKRLNCIAQTDWNDKSYSGAISSSVYFCSDTRIALPVNHNIRSILIPLAEQIPCNHSVLLRKEIQYRLKNCKDKSISLDFSISFSWAHAITSQQKTAMDWGGGGERAGVGGQRVVGCNQFFCIWGQLRPIPGQKTRLGADKDSTVYL